MPIFLFLLLPIGLLCLIIASMVLYRYLELTLDINRHAAFRVILVGLGLVAINVSAITGSMVYLGSTGGPGRNLTALGIFIAIGLIFIASGLIYGRFSNANR